MTGNSQPQLVIIEGDYDQYFVAVEQQLLLERPTAVFLLLATHYIFNLSYHPKAEDLLHFIQEKMAQISSATRKKVNHQYINGISRVYQSIKECANESDT